MSATETEIHEFPPKSGDVFYGYELSVCLKQSTDCVVFVCHKKNSFFEFVAKIGIKREAQRLSSELNFYRELEGGNGIPQLIYHKRFVKRSWKEVKEEWVEVDWTMIVIEKLRPKFAKTTTRFNKVSANMTLEELVPMAIQQISILEFIHSRGLVHKGVKPDNFVVSEDGSKVYIIDFNKSKRYRLQNGDHIQFQRDEKRPKGLPLFHSLNYHNGIRCSRRDDMESLGFCWIYLMKGSLPWSELKVKYWPKYVHDVGQVVANTTFKDLCEGLDANSSKYFIKYFEICRKLGFYDEPNYEELRQLIASSLKDSNNNVQ